MNIEELYEALLGAKDDKCTRGGSGKNRKIQNIRSSKSKSGGGGNNQVHPIESNDEPTLVATASGVNNKVHPIEFVATTIQLNDLPDDILLTIAKSGSKPDEMKDTLQQLTGVSKQFRAIVRDCYPIDENRIKYGEAIVQVLNDCQKAAFHTNMITVGEHGENYARLEIDISVKKKAPQDEVVADMKLIFKSKEKIGSMFSIGLIELGSSKHNDQNIIFSMDVLKNSNPNNTMEKYWETVFEIRDDYSNKVYESQNIQRQKYESTHPHKIETEKMPKLFKFIANLMSLDYESSINLAWYGYNPANPQVVFNLISKERKSQGLREKLSYFSDYFTFPIFKLPNKLKKIKTGKLTITSDYFNPIIQKQPVPEDVVVVPDDVRFNRVQYIPTSLMQKYIAYTKNKNPASFKKFSEDVSTYFRNTNRILSTKRLVINQDMTDIQLFQWLSNAITMLLPQTDAQPQPSVGGKKHPIKFTFKGRKYNVRYGPKGGQYIIVNAKKVYIKK